MNNKNSVKTSDWTVQETKCRFFKMDILKHEYNKEILNFLLNRLNYL